MVLVICSCLIHLGLPKTEPLAVAGSDRHLRCLLSPPAWGPRALSPWAEGGGDRRRRTFACKATNTGPIFLGIWF